MYRFTFLKNWVVIQFFNILKNWVFNILKSRVFIIWKNWVLSIYWRPRSSKFGRNGSFIWDYFMVLNKLDWYFNGSSLIDYKCATHLATLNWFCNNQIIYSRIRFELLADSSCVLCLPWSITCMKTYFILAYHYFA